MSWVPAVLPVVTTILDCIMGGKPSVEYRSDPAILELIKQLTEQNAQRAAEFKASEARFNALLESMKEKEITSFAQLEEKDSQMAAKLIELAKQAPTLQMSGRNYGFFGDTGSGKSTLLNSVIGKNEAKTGYGETTTEITPYEGVNFRVWDIPGSNDEINYLSLSYISCIKGLTKRGLLVVNTIKEQTRLINLLQKINVTFFIVVNKIDHVKSEEVESFKTKILGERDRFCPGVKVVFISAQEPTRFQSEWRKFLDELSS